MDRRSLFETHTQQRVRIVTLAILIALGVIAVIIAVEAVIRAGRLSLPSLTSIIGFIAPALSNVTPLTLLYASFLSSLILVPLPIEVFFIAGIREGSDPVLSIAATVTGFLLANLVNYLLGWKLNGPVRAFSNPRHLYKVRRAVNRYGAYAVFGMNLIPSPADVLTFGLGIVRYNFTRLFVILAAAGITKYVAIVLLLKLF